MAASERSAVTTHTSGLLTRRVLQRVGFGGVAVGVDHHGMPGRRQMLDKASADAFSAAGDENAFAGCRHGPSWRWGADEVKRFGGLSEKRGWGAVQWGDDACGWGNPRWGSGASSSGGIDAPHLCALPRGRGRTQSLECSGVRRAGRRLRRRGRDHHHRAAVCARHPGLAARPADRRGPSASAAPPSAFRRG